jgi:hypothetical protein
VVLGAPGAGKSTALQRLAYQQAQAVIEDSAAPLPIYVRLGDWTDPEKTPERFVQEQVSAVAQYAAEDRAEQNELPSSLRAFAPTLRALCEANRAVLLLDGLNELPSWRREAMVKALRAWLGELRASLPLYVACRQDDYQDPIKLDLPELRIEPLTNARIHQAIQCTFAWLAEVEGIEDPERKAEGLFEALTKDGESGVLLTLARNPYLLSLLILSWEEDRERLPDNQSQLFSFFTESLLENEGLAEVDREEGVVTGLKRPGEHLIECVSALAWELQTQRIGEAQAEGGDAGVLTTLSREAAEARFGPPGLQRAADTHLLEVGSRVRFTHQFLQEYFAARGMQSRIESGRLKAKELWRAPWERSGWEVATRLLAGFFPDDCMPVIEWLGDAQPEVTADCILHSGAHTPKEIKDALKARWLPRLTDTEQEPEPRARAALGRALGRLGLDDRKGIGLKENGLPDIDWVEIPAGELLNGDEKERRRLDSFWISRYPITNAQFDVFVAAGGYGEQRWWKGLAQRIGKPEPPGWNEPNHPCETVSWYEAMAFCAWLSDRSGFVITLPTEEQWEKAARGTDGRVYPWGDKWRDGLANTIEIGIDRTSPVGSFPQGRSPYGVLDLAGNVLEWCLNQYYYPEKTQAGGAESRVLRGGSWLYDQANARAGYRSYNHPGVRYGYLGFRVVCSSPIRSEH